MTLNVERTLDHGVNRQEPLRRSASSIRVSSMRRFANELGRRAGRQRRTQAPGIPHTILRNGWYTENHTASIGGALAGGAVPYRFTKIGSSEG